MVDLVEIITDTKVLKVLALVKVHLLRKRGKLVVFFSLEINAYSKN